jgi:hypothetical protein
MSSAQALEREGKSATAAAVSLLTAAKFKNAIEKKRAVS